MSGWRPEVFVEGKWHSNDLVFATEQEARDSAYDLNMRWTATSGWRAAQTDRAPNCSYTDGRNVLWPAGNPEDPK